MKYLTLILLLWPLLLQGQGIYHSQAGNPIGETYSLRIAQGKVPGVFFIEKFGHNPTVSSTTDETIWHGGGIYEYLSAAAIINIVSDDEADSVGNSGARTIEVQGLDANYDMQTDIVILTGSDSVQLSNQYIRIFRMFVVTTGASNTNAGDIVAVADGDTLVAEIAAEHGQTTMAIYTIPNNKTGYLTKWYSGLLRSTGVSVVVADIRLFKRLFNDGFRTIQPIGVQNNAGPWQYNFPIPLTLPEKTDIEIRGNPSASADIVGGFSIILIDD